MKICLRHRLVGLLLLAAGLGPAGGQVMALTDKVGDSSSARPYLDIAEAAIELDAAANVFIFTMKLAGPVPAAPSESFISWQWALDANPALAPGGNAFEYLATVRWSEGVREGFLVDRIQNLEVPMNFTVSENVLMIKIPAANLPSLSSFQWRAHVKLCPGACTTLTDRVPDTQMAAWPEPPVLGIERAVFLTWPTAPAGWVLEMAPAADGPWLAVPGTPTVEDHQNTLTLRAGQANLFYRLHKP